MQTIRDVEIFASGIWNDFKFSDADLADVVANTHLLLQKQRNKPPIKIGHSTAQIMQGQTDGDPAMGWMENIRQMGSKIIADFVSVPDILHEAMQKKLYRQVSAEMRFIDKLGWVITGIALLGADLPAVKNLNDLQVYLTDALKTVQPVADMSICFTTTNPQLTPGDIMTTAVTNGATPAGQPQIATGFVQVIPDPKFSELERAKSDLEKQNQELQLKLKDLLKAQTEIKFTEKRNAILKPYQEDVKAGKLQPAVYDKLEKHIDGQRLYFTEGYNLSVSAELVQEISRAYQSPLPQGETAVSTGFADRDQSTTKTADIIFAEKVAQIMTQCNINYEQATQRVKQAHPELVKQFKQFTVNFSEGRAA